MASPSAPSQSTFDLEAHRLRALPPLAYYIPNFITEQEEAYLLTKIGESPQPKWKTVGTGRRLQYWGGTLSKKNVLIPEPLPAYYTQFPDLIARITRITDAFKSLDDGAAGRDAPNQVLVNEYQPGQGISPHEDGPAYHPAVATVSLGSAAVLQIYQYLSHSEPSPPLTSSPRPTSTTPAAAVAPTAEEPDAPRSATDDHPHRTEAKPIAAIPMASIYLEPRSLYIMSSALYTSHLHGVLRGTTDTLRDDRRGLSAEEGEAAIRADGTEAQRDRVNASAGVAVANEALLSEEVRSPLERDGTYTATRATRTSLTFRKVDKVFKGGQALNLMLGKRR